MIWHPPLAERQNRNNDPSIWDTPMSHGPTYHLLVWLQATGDDQDGSCDGISELVAIGHLSSEEKLTQKLQLAIDRTRPRVPN